MAVLWPAKRDSSAPQFYYRTSHLHSDVTGSGALVPALSRAESEKTIFVHRLTRAVEINVAAKKTYPARFSTQHLWANLALVSRALAICEGNKLPAASGQLEPCTRGDDHGHARLLAVEKTWSCLALS